jgi:RNA polymerase-binding protein DksA
MKPQKRERYRQMLWDMRARVAGQAEHVTEGIRDDIAIAGNPSGAPVHLADFAMDSIEADAKVLAAEHDILGHIDAALVRIDDGSYGNCERCGRDIGEQRLSAIPYTARCAQCAQAEEDEEISPDDVQED